MATVGRGIYAAAVNEFFEGIRTFDVDRAVATLAEDADFQSPWNQSVATGHEQIQEILEGVLGDPVKRPSFTIRDISGDGNVVTLKISVSGRFGRSPRMHAFRLLHLKDRIHHVVIEPL